MNLSRRSRCVRRQLEVHSCVLLIVLAGIAGLSAHTVDLRGLSAACTALLLYAGSIFGFLENGLTHRWLQHLGRISDSLYLVHVVPGITIVNFLWYFHQSPTMAFFLFSIGIVVSILFAGTDVFLRGIT